MFERFSDHAHKVMALANREAQHLHHEYVGTEHVLLALLDEDTSVAADVLRDAGMDLRKLRAELGERIKAGPDKAPLVGKLPFAPQLKKAVEFAIEETRRMQQHYVGTEHLLLGVVREQEGGGGQVLRGLGLTVERVRASVQRLLQGETEAARAEVRATPQARQLAGYAAEEAGRLNLDYYGTEHVLLGLLADPNCNAAAVLANLGVTAQKVHDQLRNLPGPEDA